MNNYKRLLFLCFPIFFFMSCGYRTETNPLLAPDISVIHVLSPVQISSVVAENHTISISWIQPSEADFDHILITWEPGGQSQQVSKGITSFSIASLDSTVDYTFLLVSVSTASTTSSAVQVTKSRDLTPPSPIQITSEAKGLKDVSVSWSAPVDSDFEHVIVTRTPSWILDQTISKGTNSFAETGLDPTVDYTYTFVSVDDAGNRSTPVSVVKSGDRTSPGQAVLGTVNQGLCDITINWIDPSDPDFDHVLITWTPAGGLQAQPAVVKNGIQTFTVSGLDPAVEYTFSIICVDRAGNVSSPVTAVKHPDTTPPGPLKVTSVVSGDTDITINWTNPSDSDFDHVLITWTPAGGSTAQPVSVPENTPFFSVLELNRSETYTFTLTTVDLAGNKSTTPVIVTKPKDSTAPGLVTNVQSHSDDDTSITITWTNPSDVDFDYVLISWDSTGGSPAQPALVKKDALPTFTATSLDRTVDIVFRLQTVDTTGNISASYVQVIKPKDSTAPGQVTITSVIESDTIVTLNWTNPYDADIDHIEITRIPDGTVGNTGSPTVDTFTAGSLTNPVLNTASGLYEYPQYTFSLVSVDTTGNRSAPLTLIAAPSTTTKTFSVINNADDLNAVRLNLTKAYILMADIDLSQASPAGAVYSSWKPIAPGNGTAPTVFFSGDLNGSGHTVKNMKITNTTTSTQKIAFIANMSGGTVRNLSLTDVSVSSSSSYTAGLIGYIFPSAAAPTIVKNCFVSGKIYPASFSGGLIGYVNSSSTTTTYSTDINGCGTNVSIIKDSTGTAQYVGGFIGYFRSPFSISESYSSGSLSITGGNGGSNIGGFTGYTSGSITNCYSRVSVVCDSSSSGSGPYAGGFTGVNIGKTKNAYSTGDISRLTGSGTMYGAFTALISGSGSISGSYYCGTVDSSIGAAPVAAVVTMERSVSEMQTWPTYSGWDSAIWGINSSVNGGFPYLLNNPPR
jgi:hypothetical protein